MKTECDSPNTARLWKREAIDQRLSGEEARRFHVITMRLSVSRQDVRRIYARAHRRRRQAAVELPGYALVAFLPVARGLAQ